MAVLASRDALGGNLGDTYGALKIVFVYADGVYAWGENDEISSGKFEVITDATTSLSAGLYRVGTLTADLTIAAHALADDGEFIRIVDTYAITPSFKITLNLGGTIFYTDEDGNQSTATQVDIDSAFGDVMLIKSGSDWHMDVDRATPPVRGLEHTKIDSSASATTETLAASSSENIVRLFVNDNVANTATLAVQTGETLNGVLNGTFAFSDYDQGMQFRADEVTGGWVVSPLSSDFDKPTYSATVSTGVAITPDYDVNQEFTLIFDGTSTGDIDFTNGSNSDNLETSEKVRVSISNSDTVVRNLVLGSDYLKADGSTVGSIELPVGTTFRVLEFVRFGSNSFVLSYDSLDSSVSGEVGDWSASTDYVAGQLVQQAYRTLRANADFTSGATFDVVEATNWVVVSQYRIQDWAASMVIVQGEKVTYQGNIYVCAGSSFTTAATFSLGNLTLEVETNDLRDWTADTRYEVGALIRRGNMILRRQFDVLGAGSSQSVFNATEANLWEVLVQEGYSDWVQNNVYVQGEKVIVNGEVYSRNTAGQETAAAIYTRAADWTLIEDETDYASFADRWLSGIADATSGTGQKYRVTGYLENQNGYRHTFSDTDGAVASRYDLPVDVKNFQAGDTYQIQIVVAADVVSHVIEVGYQDDNGNSATKLIEMLEGSAAVVAGGADAGDVTSVASVQEVRRGNATGDVEINLILSWAANSGSNQVVTLKPVYNLDGTAVEAAASAGICTVVSAKMGAVSDFPTASDITATLIDSSAAVVTETLPAATGSGAVFLYANKDVESNDAALAVQAGEALNGITDGTFLFSNYSAGTQFRADDVDGGWVVSVAGAPSSGAYQTQVETLVYAATAVESVSYTASTVTDIGEFKIVRNYIGNGQAAVSIYGNAPNIGDDAVTFTLPTGYLTEYHMGSVDRNEINTSSEIVVTAGLVDQFIIDRDNDISGTAKFVFEVHGIGKWVGERPDAMVMAGMVPVEDMEELVFSSTLVNAGAFTLGTYADTTALIAAGFERLRISIGANHTNGAIGRDWETVEVDISDISVNDRMPFQYDNTNQFTMNWLSLVGGTLELVGVYSDALVRIYAIKAQKTVISTTDLPITGGTGTAGELLKSNGDGTASFGAVTSEFLSTTFTAINSIRTPVGTTFLDVAFGAISGSVVTYDATTGDEGFILPAGQTFLFKAKYYIPQNYQVRLFNQTTGLMVSTAGLVWQSGTASVNDKSTTIVVGGVDEKIQLQVRNLGGGTGNYSANSAFIEIERIA